MELSIENIKRLDFIKSHVDNLWKEHKASYHFFTPHDYSHSVGVKKKIEQLLPAIKHNTLCEDEYFVLSCAIFLHDVGMIPNLNEKKQKYEIINKDQYIKLRDEHHLRSQEYVENNYDKLGLQYDEARAVGILCKFHRKKVNISSCKNLLPKYRCRLLSSLLRISDALHVDNSRVEEYKYLYNLFLSMGMPRSSEFHWLKSFWIRDIEIIPNDFKAKIHFYLSNDESYIDDQELIINHAIDEIAEEIESCINVLNEEGIIFSTNIDYTCDIPPKEEDKIKIKQVISQMKIDHTASSSQLANIVSETIKYIISNVSGSDDEILKMLESYNDSEVKEMAEKKVCHVLIKRYFALVRKILIDSSINASEKLIVIRQKIDHMQNERELAIEKIALYSQGILSDGGPILLFGCSAIIISALRSMEKSLKESTNIYICECRSKNQYNYKNELIYCDGLKYADNLLAFGFKNVFFIPDIIAGNLIKRGNVSKVIFGANVVDLDNKQIGHTAGHFSIIHSAKYCNIPIYIFADLYKFGSIDYDSNKERTVNWFTGDKKFIDKLNDSGVKFLNPRSDVIDTDDVKMFVTEDGLFPPEAVPPRIIEKIRKFSEQYASLDLLPCGYSASEL